MLVLRTKKLLVRSICLESDISYFVKANRVDFYQAALTRAALPDLGLLSLQMCLKASP